jgi:hypothetical protein
MADLDAIERLDREIQEAEAQAMHNLAAHLREAVRDLPSQSRLALAFVQHAKAFDILAGGTAPGEWGGLHLRQMTREIDELFGYEEEDE